MQLHHEFTLPIPADQAWAALLDVERIAPCMPGATLDRVDGDEFSGRVTLKVGPLKLTYRGDARIAEKDERAHRLVIAAAGREARGSGTAEATVTVSLEPVEGGTRVALATDLALTGRPAQFGRGLVNEVGGSIIGQFADRLSHEMQNGGGPRQQLTEAPEPAPLAAPGGAPIGRATTATSAAAPAAKPAARTQAAAETESSLDVFSLLGPAVGSKGLLAVAGVAGLVVAFLLGRCWGSGARRQAVAPQTVPWPVAVVIGSGRR